MAFVVAATSCGSLVAGGDTGGRATADQRPDDGTAAGSDDGDLSADAGIELGRLEDGFGAGSVILAVSPDLDSGEVFGEGWVRFSPPAAKAVAACRHGEPVAGLQRTVIDFQTNESIAVSILAYADPDQAAAALEEAIGDGHGPCAAEARAELEVRAVEDGPYDAVTADLVGQVEPSLLAERGGATRWFTVELIGAGTSLRFDVATTSYVVGTSLVSIETSLVAGRDDHQLLTEQAAGAVGADGTWDLDPTIDAATERLRRAVAGPDSPSSFYDLLQSATLALDEGDPCLPLEPGLITLDGPMWSTAQGASVIVQRGAAYAEEADAVAALASLAELDVDCEVDLLTDSLVGSISYVDHASEIIERDGRQITVVTVEVTQRIDGSDIDVPVASTIAVTRVGTDLVGWRFLGIVGDEPDLVALVVDAARRIEEAGP